MVQDQTAWQLRKQKQLEADLQLLLDAQAEGLIAGVEGASIEDGALSTGNSTPTVASFSAHSPTRSPSVTRRKPNLREARRGLYTTMCKLSLLKLEEMRALEPDVDEYGGAVSKIEEWEKKQDGLRERTDKILTGEEQQSVDRLRHEADDLQPEISELEVRLSDLKQTQRRLRRQAEEAENKVQAKLSSYTTSLKMLEADVKSFLAESRTPARLGRTDEDGDGYWRLSNRQRSLHSAKGACQHQLAILQQARDAAKTEQEALEEGALIWKDVVKDVSEFERRLRGEMASLKHAQTNDEASKSVAQSGMQDLLGGMRQTMLQLESRYKLAESHGWKLLMCAIGAELDAFRKGKQVLASALDVAYDTAEEGPSEGVKEGPDQHASSDTIVRGNAMLGEEDQGQIIRDLDNAFQAESQGDGVSDHIDTDDDGPDPNFLISQHDTDTE